MLSIRLQASQQLWHKLKSIAETDAAALDLAQRQHEAGNISDLALAQQQAISTRSHLDILTTEKLHKNRERLNRLLGLWGPDTNWKIDGALPEVPNFELSPSGGLERLALSQRLDLQAAYSSVETQAKNLGLTKSFRFLGALDFGVESEQKRQMHTHSYWSNFCSRTADLQSRPGPDRKR